MDGKPASPKSPVVSLTSLANIPIRSSLKAGDVIHPNIWNSHISTVQSSSLSQHAVGRLLISSEWGASRGMQ